MSSKRFLLAVVTIAVMASADAMSSLLCPEPDDIAPCTCSFLFLDCSAVLSEEQLAKVFTAPIPINNFREFIMDNNYNIKVLRNGVFGNATFQGIQMTSGSLVEVQEEALSGSYTTVKVMKIYDNPLTSFPFVHLPKFTALKEIYLWGNNITQLPSLKSDTLTHLGMAINPLADLPVDVVQQLPNLELCDFSDSGLTMIHPGTFTGLDKLDRVGLSDNAIEHLLPGAIRLVEGGNMSLSNNKLTRIDANAITAPFGGYWLDLVQNSLTVLDEAVYRPLLEQFTLGGVILSDNPLTCGCDIAWLITNPVLMSHLWGEETCDDGTWLTSLDPASYEDCPSSGAPHIGHAPGHRA